MDVRTRGVRTMKRGLEATVTVGPTETGGSVTITVTASAVGNGRVAQAYAALCQAIEAEAVDTVLKLRTAARTGSLPAMQKAAGQ